MRYAKIVESQLVFPQEPEFAGVPNWRTNDSCQRRRGYLPLVGEPEPREGYTAVPATWHIVEQSEVRIEPRPVVVEDYEEDPETHERRKTGEHTEWQDTEITFDTSYINVDSWTFEPIPVPPPPEPEPPEPVRYSKLKIVKAMLQYDIWSDFWSRLTDDQKVLWENANEFASDYPEFEAGLSAFRLLYPDIDADEILAQCVVG